MKIVAKSIGKSEDSSPRKKEIRAGWDKLVEDYSKEAPEGLKIVYHEANIVWSWIRTEQAFYDGATQGMAIRHLDFVAYFIVLLWCQLEEIGNFEVMDRLSHLNVYRKYIREIVLCESRLATACN